MAVLPDGFYMISLGFRNGKEILISAKDKVLEEVINDDGDRCETCGELLTPEDTDSICNLCKKRYNIP